MRTTLTIDPDIAALIERELSLTGLPLKTFINDTLRKGFAAAEPKRAYAIPGALDLGAPLLPDVDNIADVLDLISNDPR